MPALLEDPCTTVLDVSISMTTADVVTTLASMLQLKSLDFSALPVLINTRRCLEHAMNALPAADEPMADACGKLDAAIADLKCQQLASPGVTAGFLPAKRPALRLLTRLPDQAPEPLMQTIGNLLISSWLTGLPLPRQRCESLSALCRACMEEPSLTNEQTSILESLLRRSRNDLLETLAQRVQTQDKDILRFNSLLINHLRSEVSSAHPERQRDSDLRHFVAGSALSGAMARLQSDMIAGDSEALVTLIGFSLNLHWDLLIQVPLHRGTDSQGHTLWLDPTKGVGYVDVRPLLRELGKPIQGCEVAKDTLRLPLPEILAKHLRIAAAARPSARRVGDLSDQQELSAVTLGTARANSLRAQLLRSAPSVAIRESGNRAVAAYGFLAFHLLDHADLPYCSVSEEQIWRLRAQVFEVAGLGGLVAADAPLPGRIGSARTARGETVRSVFAELDAAVTRVRIGRRYGLVNLIEHHNQYTRRVGMFLQFVSGARATQTPGFVACSWFDGSLFGYLDDKDVGAAGGRTPIPISPSTTLQLKLWRLHIQSLQRRLIKQIGYRAKAASAHIEAIGRRESVPLLFMLDDDGVPQPMRTEYLFTGMAAHLNRDWGRHAMASRLTAADQPLADVHFFLRHQGGGINPQSALGTEVQIDRLQRTALSIDLILSDLNILPLAGLVGVAR
jgi:hypothetical protein